MRHVIHDNEWVGFALIACLLGFTTSNPIIQLHPPFLLEWNFDLLIGSINSVLYGYGQPLLTLLVNLPLLLAVIGSIGFWTTHKTGYLRIGFLPTLLYGIIYYLSTIFMALYGELMIPLSGIAFLIASYASHHAKKQINK